MLSVWFAEIRIQLSVTTQKNEDPLWLLRFSWRQHTIMHLTDSKKKMLEVTKICLVVVEL